MTKSKAHPPSTKLVIFWTKEGIHEGFYVKNINKYISGVRRWKDVRTETWYDDDEVTNWKYFEHWPEEALDGEFKKETKK